MKPLSLRLLVRLFSLVVLMLCTVCADAHNSSKGITAVRVHLQPDSANVKFAMSFFDVTMLTGLDKDKNDEITSEELAAGLANLKEAVLRDLSFSFDGKKATPVTAKPSIQESNFEVEMVFTNISTAKINYETKLIARLTPEHQEMVTFLNEKEEEILLRTLFATDNKVELIRKGDQTTASAEAEGAGSASFLAFLQQGMKHIFTGYDHLLFLFALLIMCERFMAVVKIITCFTVAHSITLCVAALGIVPVNSKIIEPLIAATIIYVGVENLLKLKTIQWRWLVTFVFGLIHGFGFAGVLTEMGLSSKNLLLPVLSFNLGVELGQICIAALVLPILWRLQKMPEFAPKWVPACSLIVVALGGYWFVERVWL